MLAIMTVEVRILPFRFFQVTPVTMLYNTLPSHNFLIKKICTHGGSSPFFLGSAHHVFHHDYKQLAPAMIFIFKMADVQATSQEPEEVTMKEPEAKEVKMEESAEPEPEPEPQNPTSLEELSFQGLSTVKVAEFVFDGWDFSFVRDRWNLRRNQMTTADLIQCAEITAEDEEGGDEHEMIIDIYKFIFSRPSTWPMKYEHAKKINAWAMRVFDSALSDDEKASLQQPKQEKIVEGKKTKWPKIDLPAPDTAVVGRKVKIGKDEHLTTLERHVMLNASAWFKALREQEETERNQDDEMA